MAFRYEAYDRHGQRVRGVLETDSEESAERYLWDNDLTIIKLARARKPILLHEQIPSLFGVRTKDIVDLSKQLAFLIRAGINIFTALQIIRDQTTKPALRAVLSAVVEDVSQGLTLSEACSRHPNAFPIVFVRMLMVGEGTGRTDVALQQVADYMERQMGAMQKVRSSLTYPAFVLITAGIAMYILLTVALPNLLGLFREFGAQMPLPTRILMASVAFAGAWGQSIGLVVGAIVVGLVIYSRTPKGRRRLHYILIGLPVMGPVIVKLNMARIADTMGSLISGGIPVLETLDLLVTTTQNSALKEPLEEIKTSILSGSSLSQAVGNHAVFPAMMVSLLRVGEEAGTLEETLATLGRLYNEEADRSISALVGLMEPALTVGIGVAIAFISITIISTVYSILPQIK